MTLSADDLQALARAKQQLEQPGLAARIGHFVGAPIERGLKALPGPISGIVASATEKAVSKALQIAVTSLGSSTGGAAREGWHKLAAGAAGAAGGAFGFAALAAELPVSTAIMLRSIAAIARSEGEDLADPAVRLACVQVLALGGPGKADDASEAGYFTSRAALAQAVQAAARHLAQRKAADSSAPVMVAFAAQVAARFSIPVSEKVMAQAVPVVGAVGGAALNTLFIDHFQTIAHGHFTVRRLERSHGEAAVREAYERL